MESYNRFLYVCTGPGLAFIVFPRAVAMMPMPQVWSVCFFIMIILLSLDSQVSEHPLSMNKPLMNEKLMHLNVCVSSFQFVGLECLMTSVVDLFPYLRRGFRRELLLLVICTVCCLLGFSLVTEVGTMDTLAKKSEHTLIHPAQVEQCPSS